MATERVGSKGKWQLINMERLTFDKNKKSLLGAGGYGEVYRARHAGTIAIKEASLPRMKK